MTCRPLKRPLLVKAGIAGRRVPIRRGLADKEINSVRTRSTGLASFDSNLM